MPQLYRNHYRQPHMGTFISYGPELPQQAVNLHGLIPCQLFSILTKPKDREGKKGHVQYNEGV